MYYVAIDGDDVGRKLEYFTLTNNEIELVEFAYRYNTSMIWLQNELKETLNAQVLFIGGDNLLASIDKLFPMKAIDLIREQFYINAGNTISIGIGGSPREALFALKIAKASGKNRVTIYDFIEENSNQAAE